VRSRTAGVMTTLMRNGRDRRSGKPVKGHAILERVLLVGTRSADHIRASGHSGCIEMEASSPSENRPDTWLHPNASHNVRFLLHRGRRPYMALHDISLRCGILSLSGHSAHRSRRADDSRTFTALFDHFVCKRQESFSAAQELGGRKVNDELKFGRLLEGISPSMYRAEFCRQFRWHDGSGRQGLVRVTLDAGLGQIRGYWRSSGAAR
jgi:hypothetical protein